MAKRITKKSGKATRREKIGAPTTFVPKSKTVDSFLDRLMGNTREQLSTRFQGVWRMHKTNYDADAVHFGCTWFSREEVAEKIGIAVKTAGEGGKALVDGGYFGRRLIEGRGKPYYIYWPIFTAVDKRRGESGESASGTMVSEGYRVNSTPYSYLLSYQKEDSKGDADRGDAAAKGEELLRHLDFETFASVWPHVSKQPSLFRSTYLSSVKNVEGGSVEKQQAMQLTLLLAAVAWRAHDAKHPEGFVPAGGQWLAAHNIDHLPGKLTAEQLDDIEDLIRDGALLPEIGDFIDEVSGGSSDPVDWVFAIPRQFGKRFRDERGHVQRALKKQLRLGENINHIIGGIDHIITRRYYRDEKLPSWAAKLIASRQWKNTKVATAEQEKAAKAKAMQWQRK